MCNGFNVISAKNVKLRGYGNSNVYKAHTALHNTITVSVAPTIVCHIKPGAMDILVALPGMKLKTINTIFWKIVAYKLRIGVDFYWVVECRPIRSFCFR